MATVVLATIAALAAAAVEGAHPERTQLEGP